MIVSALTDVAPSVEFVHGMLARSAGLLTEVHDRIRTLITLSYAVSCDETPLKVGPKTPKVGKKKTERYLLVAPQSWTPTTCSATDRSGPSQRSCWPS